ncbi:hypothetical protein NM688_g3778 [Phlebia brevispora]|uniref:Uncharacterized protein n=1 Tax=Phlebia brevispora TaxID=194682 RepID=A0ACC1T4V6_9APHY|nr:hypothetical protein NM688_g3778 [Phlebia brevispora]
MSDEVRADSTSTQPAPPIILKFSSPEGVALVRNTLRALLPFDPHTYQLDGICTCLDGQDLIAICPTGSGKTEFFSMYILMLRALSANPNLCRPSRKVPQDPAMVFVCPTIGLEEDVAAKFTCRGLSTLVINHKTVEDARTNHQMSLWVRARKEVSMIVLSPEMLSSKGFECLLQDRDFSARCLGLGVDEIHLLDAWGAGFRKSFLQIGHVRARMPSQTVLIGVTATLAVGEPTRNVLRFLGLREGDFHLIRCSNRRDDIRVIYRTLRGSLGGWTFPDFKHVLDGKRKTLIYCDTISLTFRLTAYLISIAPSMPSPVKRIRMYNSLNSPEYNEETRRLFQEDFDMQIVIATNALIVGIDLRNVEVVILARRPKHPDEENQKKGRAGRDKEIVKNPVCEVYWGKNDLAIARAMLDGTNIKKAGGKGRLDAATMDLAMARVLLADCRTHAQDILYDNPLVDPPCTCEVCSRKPLVIHSCISSCCMPEDTDNQDHISGGLKPKKINPIKRRLRLTRVMRALGKRQLEELRWAIYMEEDEATTGMVPSTFFLPNDVIQGILDHFALLTNSDTLDSIIPSNSYVKAHQARIWDAVVELRTKFAEIRAKKKWDNLGIIDSEDDDEDGDEDEAADNDLSDVQLDATHRLTIRLSADAVRAALAPPSHTAGPSTSNTASEPLSPRKNRVPVTPSDVQTSCKRAAYESLESPRRKTARHIALEKENAV